MFAKRHFLVVYAIHPVRHTMPSQLLLHGQKKSLRKQETVKALEFVWDEISALASWQEAGSLPSEKKFFGRSEYPMPDEALPLQAQPAAAIVIVVYYMAGSHGYGSSIVMHNAPSSTRQVVALCQFLQALVRL